MNSVKQLEDRLDKIEQRNKRVETDKIWETSLTRRGLLITFTYLAVGFYMQAIEIKDPWINAVVPSAGFLLSTLTLPLLKNLWLKYIYKQKSI